MLASAARSEDAQIAALNRQVLEHFRGANYAEAKSLAERAVAETKARSGEKHRDHIKALLQLGHVLIAYQRATEGEPTIEHLMERAQASAPTSEAEKTFKHALDLATATLPADDLLLADALDGVGTASTLEEFPYGGMKRMPEIEPLRMRSLAIREKRIKADPTAYLDLVERMASMYWITSRGSECDRLMARAIDIAKEQLGQDHPVVAGLLWKFADVSKFQLPEANAGAYATDAQQGFFGTADSFKKMMDATKSIGTKNLDALDGLGGPLMKQLAESKKYEAPSIAILDKLVKAGQIDASTRLTTEGVRGALSGLALEHRFKDRFAEAERVFMLIRDMRPQEVNASYLFALGDNWKTGMDGLLDLYDGQRRYQDYDRVADQLSARDDAERAKKPRLTKLDMYSSINDKLARHYEMRQDVARAESYLKKDISAFEAASDLAGLAGKLAGTNDFIIRDDALDGLAGFYERHERWADAEATLQRAIDTQTQLSGANHRKVKELNRQLGLFHERRAGTAKKEPSLSMPKFVMPDFLGDGDKAEGGVQCDEDALTAILKANKIDPPPGCTAGDMMRVGMRVWGESIGGGQDDFLFQVMHGQAAFQRGDWKTVVDALSRAGEIDFADRQAGKRVPPFLWTDSEQRPIPLPLMLIKAAARLAETQPERQAALLETTFTAAQRSQLLAVATALGQMTARQSSGSTALAKLVRERESLSSEWNRLDLQLKQAILQVSQRPEGRSNAAERARLDEIPIRIASIDKTLAQDFPDYLSLAKPQPLSVTQVQAHLRPDEALVLMVATPQMGTWGDENLQLPEWMKGLNAPAESFVWVVTKQDARWVKVELKGKNLAEEIFTLRCGLDDAYWDGEPRLRQRCEGVLKAERSPGEKPPFHLHRALALYRALFGEVEDLIMGKQLLIAATGPFTVLPFQVLVTEELGVGIPIIAASTDPAAYKGVSWLGTRQPITLVPSVASLVALRQSTTPSSAKRPFIGFGNPLLTGRPEIAAHRQRAALVQQGLTCRRPPVRREHVALANLPSADALSRGRLADVELLRQQIPLPETADELCSIANKLGAREQDVLLGGRMTESEIKSLSTKGELRDYRVLHFATHGLLASDTQAFIDGRAEPALMFTPPKTATEADDGLLTASEVTQLELDADWVIMSACSTASGEGRDSEALSGLARAFFYAGARSLLVSHWAVDSDAAVSITTGAVEALASDAEIGKAEALRRSIVALQKKGGINLHPAIWAPFSLVGGEAR